MLSDRHFVNSQLTFVNKILIISLKQEMSGDLVATWEVSLADNVHTIEFEHGTTSGKRVIRVDGKVNFVKMYCPILFIYT